MFRNAVLLASLLLANITAAEPVDVYFFSGQSNMAGAAKVAELDEALRQPIRRNSAQTTPALAPNWPSRRRTRNPNPASPSI